MTFSKTKTADVSILPKYVKNQKPSEAVILYAGINIIYQGRICNNSEIIEFLILNYFLIYALVIFHGILFSRLFFTDFFLKEEVKWKTFKLLFTAGYFFAIFIFMMILNNSHYLYPVDMQPTETKLHLYLLNIREDKWKAYACLICVVCPLERSWFNWS